MNAQEKEREGDVYGGSVILQAAFSEFPEKLDPVNPYLNKIGTLFIGHSCQ